MAYIVSSVSNGTDTVLSSTISFGEWFDNQQTGDYIVVVANNDGGGTAVTISGGWTQIYSSAAIVSGTRAGIFYAKNTGTPLTAPTFTGALDDWAVCAVLIRDADGTTFLDVAAATTEQTANTQTPTCPAVTTVNDNCLILRVVTVDGTNSAKMAVPFQGVAAVYRGDNITNTTMQLGCLIDFQTQFTAGSTGTYGCVAAASDGGTQTTIAIRNASGGKVAAVPTNTPMSHINDLSSAPTGTLLVTLHPTGTVLGYDCAASDTTGGAIRGQFNAITAAQVPRGYPLWTRSIGQTQTDTTGVGSRTYGAAWSVTANLSANLFVACIIPTVTTFSTRLDDVGGGLYFRDGAGAWAVYRPHPEAKMLEPRVIVAHLPSETMADSGGGSIDWTNITYIGGAFPVSTGGSVRNWEWNFYLLATMPYSGGKITPINVCGGASTNPITPRDLVAATSLNVAPSLTLFQGSKQQVFSLPITLGDGTKNLHFSGDAQAMEVNGNATVGIEMPAGSSGLTIKAKSTDTIRFNAMAAGSVNSHGFTIDAASSTSATYDFGGTLFGVAPTFISGLTVNGVAFVDCGIINGAAATFSNCTITNTTSSNAAVTFSGNSSLSNSAITLRAATTNYHIELDTGVTAFTLTNVTFSGTPVVDKVHVKRTTGTVTITLSGTTLVAGDVTSDGATVVLSAPSDDLTVTSNQSGTLLQVFTAGTQTVLASTTGTSLVYTHASETVDIVAQKAGYLPQRVTGVVLSGDVTRAFTMVSDFNYNASHGLVYTTDASWSRANNQLTVPSWSASRTVRAVYSLMIDAFIAQSSLLNTPFNLSMNGQQSLFLTNGAEGATDASITNMVAGGVRYLSGAGATTAEFTGIQSSGVVSGSQAEYELGAAAIADARATGNVNEILKVYGDATHGNFDRRSNLQLKVQRNGYREAYYDVVANYGNLTPVLYIISLPMVAIDGLTLGDPGASGLTLTKHGSPVSWDAGDGPKNYSVTLTDSATNSGDTILRWLNYNLSLDATFQGTDPFNWPELVLDNGAAYETIRGTYHGSPDAVVGVRVIRTGGTPHPDFTRFQSDDGTYGTPPIVATAAISGILTGSKVRIYNVTTATETFIGTPGTSYSQSYTNGTTYTAGDSINVRVTKRGRLTYETTVVAAASGWAVSANQPEDEVYTTLGIDGSLVTGFAADYANDEVNVTIAANFNVADMYAWWSYNLEADQAIREFVGGLTALDIGNFRINNAVVDIYIDNTTATNLRQLDNRRIFRADEAYPVKSSGGGGIDVVWRNTILIAATGSAVLPSDIIAIGAEVATRSQAGELHADVRWVNDVAVTGDGQVGSEWGPA